MVPVSTFEEAITNSGESTRFIQSLAITLPLFFTGPLIACLSPLAAFFSFSCGALPKFHNQPLPPRTHAYQQRLKHPDTLHQHMAQKVEAFASPRQEGRAAFNAGQNYEFSGRGNDAFCMQSTDADCSVGAPLICISGSVFLRSISKFSKKASIAWSFFRTGEIVRHPGK